MYPPISISAEEVNYLVYRYLLESGFRHSVFAFENESQIVRKLDEYRALEVRPGQLITLLHKALQVIQVEMHMDDDGSERDCEATLSLLNPHNCIIPSEATKRARRKAAAAAAEADREATPGADGATGKKARGAKTQRKGRGRGKNAADPQSEDQGDMMDVDGPTQTTLDDVIVQVQVNGTTDAITTSTDPVITLQSSNERYYVSAWNPIDDHLLASGSLGSVVGLWNVPSDNGALSDATLIAHESDEPNNEVTCIAWSPNGEYLATGTKDAKVRVFTKKGEPVLSFAHPPPGIGELPHNPVLVLSFNPASKLLASGSASGTVIVWNLDDNVESYSSSAHTQSIMAFDWYDTTTLASGSVDATVRLTDVVKGTQTVLSGHTKDVNDVKWDPYKRWLATCSDDATIRIWTRDRAEPVVVLRGHERPVLTIDWNPKPPGNVPQLASVSLDSTIRVWDATTGNCIYTMSCYVLNHCVLTYSPDGRYLACGSDDQYLYVWTSNGHLVKTFYGHGDILDLRYNRSGDRLAVCFGTSRLAILPISSPAAVGAGGAALPPS
ncbi:hypothetical protein AMAG_00693 [Allomyces macrogynus ATCC 38327]|uniref:LisH domain-containing protein n=1 Tax=Allomyces macrogynus (strain ATCC 38327) TaxID=578462 RepID=A0A0L0RX80_ALLM3|nr:hypothetical protein AMAG_00693 [Allomyces macrogynus ATCC 38327]|eukprot:KNE54734.1 hypothetical protein AMAG_00693 [Allomyces macrogynus ATCC 38327]